MFNRIIGIGWDVGGWMGNKQGIAVATWSIGGNSIEWLGLPSETNIPKNQTFTPDSLISKVSGVSYKTLPENTRLIMAIDAPLGFPEAFRKLVVNEREFLCRTEREIDNPLAYRYTEQHIYEALGKKPLSATFDKLGNNSTVAIYHMQKWRDEYGYTAYPFDNDQDDDKAIIEVYPALLKNSAGEVDSAIKKCLPKGIREGTDAYDACICAFLAVLYAAQGRFRNFSSLVAPPPKKLAVNNEGWIYYLPKY